MIKNSIIYSIIFLAILGNFSCRKEWVKPDDIVQKPIDSTSNKINTFEYELKPGIIDVTSKARDLIIDETPDQLIVKRTLETENLFEVNKIYYHVGFDFTEFKNAYRIKEIKKENDRIIVEKRNLAFVDSYEMYHLINNNPESGKIKTRGDILQNDWNFNFNAKLPITFLEDKGIVTKLNAKAASTSYAQEIKIAGGILSIFSFGIKIQRNAEFSFQFEKETSIGSIAAANKIFFFGVGGGTGGFKGFSGGIGIALILNADLDIKGTLAGILKINQTFENIGSIGTGKVTKYLKDGEERDTIIIDKVGGSSNSSPELDVNFVIEGKAEITLTGNVGMYVGILFDVNAFNKRLTAFLNFFGASFKSKFSYSGEGTLVYINLVGKNNLNEYAKTGLCGKLIFQFESLTIYFLEKVGLDPGISPVPPYYIEGVFSTQDSGPNIEIDIGYFKSVFPKLFIPVTIFNLSKKDGSDCFIETKIEKINKFNFADIIYKNGKPYFFYSYTKTELEDFTVILKHDFNNIIFTIETLGQNSYGNVHYGFIDLTQVSSNLTATEVETYKNIPLSAEMELTITDGIFTVYEHLNFSNYSKLEMEGQTGTIDLPPGPITKLWTRENIYIDNLPNEKIDEFYGTRMTFEQAFSKGGQSRPEGNCPDGYHIPTLEEWNTILENYQFKIFDENNISERKRNTFGLFFKQLGIDMLADNSLNKEKESYGSITTYWVAAPESGELGKEVQKVVIANNNQKVSIEGISKYLNHRAYCRCIQD